MCSKKSACFLDMKSMFFADAAFKKVVLIVALLNLSFFVVEFVVALWIDSVSLYADSIDFLEDFMVNFLILVALGWSAYKRAAVGMVLAGILLIPSSVTLWTAWQKFFTALAPDGTILSATGGVALLVNFYCAFLLARFRSRSCSLSKAAFLSARNDAIANLAIVIAGVFTRATSSAWPDLVVGLGIFLLNLKAAKEVYAAARQERFNS